MNTRRSYLDTLNAGRPRKAHASLEDLNRSLENLESRLGRNRDTSGDGGRGNHAGRQAWDEPDRYGERPQRREVSYRDIARDIDRVRNQEEGIASVGRIASELKGLREELRDQMTAGLKREFDMLRRDIARAYTQSPAGRGGAELGVEFERLSGAIQALSERSDDRGINMLRLELAQVKEALDTLAREETVRSVDRHWEDFDKRWSQFESRYSAGRGQMADDPAIEALNMRLEQINEAVNNLPESLSLRSLEEKVRILAGAVDHFTQQQDKRGDETYGLIEERLDEISRAIVASTASLSAPHFDPAPFERIEARISSLAHQVEELTEDRPTAEMLERLGHLAHRIDEIAAQGVAPEEAIERLARQIAIIADKIDNAPATPDAEPILRGIESRFEMLSDMLDRRQGDALEHGQAMFRDLERRLDEVAGRINEAPAGADAGHILGEIETRFSALSDLVDRRQGDAIEHGQSLFRDLEQRLENVAARLDERQAPAFDDSNLMNAIDARFEELARKLAPGEAGAGAEAMREMEARLEDISARLEASASHVAAIDPDIIRNLESQVSELSAHLARPSAPLPEHEDIGPRLDEIERSISGSRDTVLEAARQAAENAVQSFAGSATDSAAVAGLAEDLKSLEELTRRSDERNTKTFEAIHDTLLKIVDRLGSLENDGPAIGQGAVEPRKMALGATPPLDAEDADPVEDTALPIEQPTVQPARASARMTPAQAAVAAAEAAMDGEEQPRKDEKPARPRSMLGGLTRAFRAKKERVEPSLAGMQSAEAEDQEPAFDLDEPLDPKLANKPLEPGSGAPDLSAIMKRVRDERGQQQINESDADTAKSDFIAAARRAAQAAAAEAGTLKKSAETGGSRKSFGIGEFLRTRRKTMLMGAVAVMLALAGMQLGKAFFKDDARVAKADQKAAVTEQKPVETAQMSSDAGSDATATETVAAAPVRVVASTPDTTADPEPGTPDETLAAGDMPMDADDDDSAMDAAQDDEGGMSTAAVSKPDDDLAAPSAERMSAEPALPPAPIEAGPLALREAADAGDPKALFEIGTRYAEGHGLNADMAKAAKWYQRSADLGFAPAQYRIGNFYEKGTGVARDIGKAKTWYQLAAQQGNASAMHNLAVLYAMGADGVADNDSAARWFLKAAELGVKDSQFNLGILAAKGVGMPQDLEESYKWFALVAKTGDADAVAKRDEIANALRPEQLQHARAATELWKPKPVNVEANTVEIPEAWQDTDATRTASVDMKKAIENIQLILNKNGYDAGGADGVMGEKTKNAIIAFQKDNGLEATGEITEKLVSALLAKK